MCYASTCGLSVVFSLRRAQIVFRTDLMTVGRYIQTGDSAATPLFRSSSSDVSLAMSQRLGLFTYRTVCSDYLLLIHSSLARRFKKQMFLSIDVPAPPIPSPENTRIFLEVEKLLIKTLKELEP
jgi:hypothetical protein